MRDGKLTKMVVMELTDPRYLLFVIGVYRCWIALLFLFSLDSVVQLSVNYCSNFCFIRF